MKKIKARGSDPTPADRAVPPSQHGSNCTVNAGELSRYSSDEAASVTHVQGNTVSVELIINAPSAQIFALIADAGKPSSIDGSGTVDHSVPNVAGRASPGEKSQPLELGSKFGMSMRGRPETL